MGTKATRLNQKQIENAKPKEKDYVLSDGDGLQLRIRKNGSRLWNFNYRHPITKKRINMGLGTFPELPLAQARKYTMSARSLVAQGIDPKEFREQQKIDKQNQNEHTLINVSSEWFKLKKDTISPDYAEDMWRSLEIHIFPHIANKAISKITAPIVITTLRPIEAKGNLETVKRLAQRLNEIMNYAVNCGLIFSNPLSGIKAAFKKPNKKNMPSILPNGLPELMNAIANANIKRTTRCLIEWQLHTMTRPCEAAGARWDEIDLNQKVWTIPAERMKKKREHRIPLTDHTVALLEVMKPISQQREFVFPSDRSPLKPYNNQTANMALRRMGFEKRLVSHGLRSLASTTLNEQGFDSDLIEAALAHVDRNQVRSAYNRTDYLERRIPMMVWWSEHIIKASLGSLSITGSKQLNIL
ncbi:integrase [Photobacterium angustum]|uniref:integrase domain-containing protein n=1 Tax=Photobacterium angustum TaxID=661 RepID=UPI000D1A0AE3|nr:integrase domain-containing protein [Photobacterium angustum]PSV91981.1 integrase [Photobacterium angustum]